MQAHPSSFQIWFHATRPKTLPAAIAPVVLASAYAYYLGVFHFIPALVCLFFTLLIQIGTNFANDYYDGIKGTDTEKRIGPTRAVASGLVSPEAMFKATAIVLALAFCVGLILVYYGGWWLVWIGIASVILAVAYTGGPYPLGYNGLGDIFVIMFFGFVAVMFSFYVQAGFFTWPTFWLGLGIGLMTNNILVVNNYRDYEEDVRAGKRTLVVRYGRNAAYLQYVWSLWIALWIPLLMAVLYGLNLWLMLILPIAIAYPGWQNCRSLQNAQSKLDFNTLLAKTAVLVIAYSGVLSVLFILSAR